MREYLRLNDDPEYKNIFQENPKPGLIIIMGVLAFVITMILLSLSGQ